ncbi:TPA: VRR-NUC domain-containing protein [Morganella morganii]|uniref:VRR-NUC domain-containing protein n=1 Tax=Morganella morganii TaxID=582 RepID=UPI0009249C98|nr:VRR-NUC domain-containing protein [Morganella morganii]SHL68680.1 VRR-NUC domain-containing protein [Morganella morganii]
MKPVKPTKPMKEVCPGGTTVTCRVEGAQLPSLENECYLKAKAVFASYFPRASYTKDGAKRSLKQLVMSGLIRAEESLADWLWPYKAEVVFAMRGEINTPLPILATSADKRNKYGNDLPHSSNPFAMPPSGQWVLKGITGRRRPDIILVKKETNRWPGRGENWEGPCIDNLHRLIEVKFPGDFLNEGQEYDYKLISTEDRFSVLHVEENRRSRRKEREKAWEAQEHLLAEYEKKTGHKPVFSQEALENLVLVDFPLVSENLWRVKPVASLWWALNVDVPAFGQAVLADSQPVSGWQMFTDGIQEAGEYLVHEARGYIVSGYEYTRDTAAEAWAVSCDYIGSGLDFLSVELAAAFAATGVWFRESGKWVVREVIEPGTNALMYGVYWLSDVTGELIQMSQDYLLGEWRKICFYTDLTIEVLQNVKWSQIMTDLGNGMVQVALWVEDHVFEIVASVAVAAAIVVLVALIPATGGASGAGAVSLSEALAAFLVGGTLTLSTQ